MKTAPFLLLVASGPALLVGELSAKLTERLFFHEPRATSLEPRFTRYRVIKDVLITQFLPKNSLTYHIRDDKISKCRNECIASKLQDVRSEVS